MFSHVTYVRTRNDRLEDYLLLKRGSNGSVAKKERVWLASAIKLAQEGQVCSRSLAVVPSGGKRPTHASGKTPDRFLQRRRFNQGRAYKCPLIRELLWDWFVDIRRSVATTITPKFVLLKARSIADLILKHQRKTGAFEAMPVLDKHWLLRWKRDKGVVFRRPNMRFKCAKPVLLLRLRAMWRNAIAVRRLAELALGTDLSDRIWGIDEKPVHFNESGSKGTRSLELVGCPAVKLKQNHAATRERVSVMTLVTSCPQEAAAASNLLVEILFRAKTNKRTKALVAPKDLRVSFAYAEKGSYRTEQLVAYLKRWLPSWTQDRAERRDFRILFLDVAKSHVGDEILDICRERGFVPLFHYGCTTGIAQVNDTDLHDAFERVYLEMEQAAFTHQQLHDPGCVARRPQDVVDDTCATWRCLDHVRGASGHKRNGLNVRLDGSEDHMLSRMARQMWFEANMPSVRTETLRVVQEAWNTGRVASFADYGELLVHPEDPGVLQDEGAELEGDLLPDELPWADEEQQGLVDADNNDVMADQAGASSKEEASNQAAMVIHEMPGDKAEDIVDAVVSAKRLAMLKRMRDDAREARVPSAFFAVDREVQQLERGYHAKDGTRRRENAVLRRAVEAAAQKEAATLAAKRSKAMRLKQKERMAKFKAAKAKVFALVTKAANKLEKAKKLALAEGAADKVASGLSAPAVPSGQSGCDVPSGGKVPSAPAVPSGPSGSKVPSGPSSGQSSVPTGPSKPSVYSGPSVQFTASACAGKTKGVKARRDCLERLKVGSPPLPAEAEAEWQQVRDSYARHFCVITSAGAASAGAAFVSQVNKVVAALGEHYTGGSYKAKSPKGSDPAAFLRFFRMMRGRVPKPALAHV